MKTQNPSRIIGFICYIMSHICLIHSTLLRVAVQLFFPSSSFALTRSARIAAAAFFFRTPAHNRIIHFMKTHNQILNTPKYVTRILKSIYRPICVPVQTNTAAIFTMKTRRNQLKNTHHFTDVCTVAEFFSSSPLTEIGMSSVVPRLHVAAFNISIINSVLKK